ncbi:MAG: hypothetical protein GY929_07925, partial [Actinomycetia bacterium]|nr:hypothetical protein [Actinomycetes bacterium]
HLEDVCDQRVDRAMISRITDGIVADMEAWQSRPLDAVYPVLLVDGIRIKIRDGTVSNRVVYVVMGDQRQPCGIAGRRTRHPRAVGWAHRRRITEVLVERDDRAPQPRCR